MLNVLVVRNCVNIAAEFLLLTVKILLTLEVTKATTSGKRGAMRLRVATVVNVKA